MKSNRNFPYYRWIHNNKVAHTKGIQRHGEFSRRTSHAMLFLHRHHFGMGSLAQAIKVFKGWRTSIWLLKKARHGRFILLLNARGNSFKDECLHFLEPLFRKRNLSQEPPSIFFRSPFIVLLPLQHHMSTNLPNRRVNLCIKKLRAHFSKSLFLCITLFIAFETIREVTNSNLIMKVG